MMGLMNRLSVFGSRLFGRSTVQNVQRSTARRFYKDSQLTKDTAQGRQNRMDAAKYNRRLHSKGRVQIQTKPSFYRGQ